MVGMLFRGLQDPPFLFKCNNAHNSHFYFNAIRPQDKSTKIMSVVH